MEPIKQSQSALDKKLKKVLQTQPGYDFYLAIHSFIEFIESNPTLAKSLTSNIKANRELNIPGKYDYLKQVYQGLEDVNIRSNVDLGHARYAMIKDLNNIQKNIVSEHNTLWKKREFLRKTVGEVHTRLSEHISKLNDK